MILERLSVKDFRQFGGQQHVEFASDASSDNVTVILGENGRGKTGLYRALMFCLFGDRSLSQDEGAPNEELLLVNTGAVQSADGPVEASVNVRFIHDGKRYEASRRVHGLIDAERQLEELGDVRLTVTEETGNTKIVTDPREFDDEMRQVLDPRVKDYFLFDGEKIERLTRATAAQRDEVARGIKTLLSVDALEMAIAVSRDVMNHFESRIDDDLDVERARIAHELDRVETRIVQVREEIETLENEEAGAEEEIEKLDERLSTYEEVRELVERRHDAEDELEQHNGEIDRFRAAMRDNMAAVSMLLIAPALDSVYEEIDASKERGDIPPEIKSDLIEKLLEDGHCICGRSLEKGSEAWQEIMEWHSRVGDAATHDAALDLWRDLARLTRQAGDIHEDAESILSQYGNACALRETVRKRIDQLDEQIGSSQREDAAQLETQRTAVAGQLEKTRTKSHLLRDEEVELSREQERLQAELREKDGQLKRSSVRIARVDLARRVHQALNGVSQDFTKNLRETISEDATDYFSHLVDDEGLRALDRVTVDDRYSLEVQDKFGQDFLANISAGQRQMVSISFILALAKTAGGTSGGLLQMPLFMDTPFGRLAFNHRASLLAALPEECSQWVLLVTDTEFTRSEARVLQSGGNWSRFYRLEAMEDGSTRISEYSREDAFPILSEGAAVT